MLINGVFPAEHGHINLRAEALSAARMINRPADDLVDLRVQLTSNDKPVQLEGCRGQARIF